MKTIHRHFGERGMQWSIPSAASDLPNKAPLGVQHKYYRLLIDVDPDDSNLVNICDVRVTSASDYAQQIRSTENRFIALNREEARWLLEVLPKALKIADEAAAEIDAELMQMNGGGR